MALWHSKRVFCSLCRALRLLVGILALARKSLSKDADADTFLQSLLGPKPEAPGVIDFFSSFWQLKPTVIRRRNPGFYSAIISSADVDAILSYGMSLTQLLGAPPNVPGLDLGSELKLGRDWHIVQRQKGPDGEWWSAAPNTTKLSTEHEGSQTDLDIAHNAFVQGYSIVVNAVDKRWQVAGRLADLLEKSLGLRVSFNLYLTPPNNQGFEHHFDWMDSLVLQIEGNKQWSLYDTLVEQPRPDMVFKPRAAQLDEPYAKFILQAGDLLYLPSGSIHEATTLLNNTTEAPSQHSLHLTIGIESTVLGSWESLFLDLVGRTLDGWQEGQPSGLVCKQNGEGEVDVREEMGKIEADAVVGRDVGQVLGRSVLFAGQEVGLRWGDVMVACIVEVAQRVRELRMAVPMGKLVIEAAGGSRVVQKMWMNRVSKMSRELDVAQALRGLSERSGELGRDGSSVRDSQRRLRSVFDGKKVQRAVAMVMTEDDIKLGKEVVRSFACSLGDQEVAEKALKAFRKVCRADLRKREVERNESLQKLAWKSNIQSHGGDGAEIYTVG